MRVEPRQAGEAENATAARVRDAYRGYRLSERRMRAWSPSNPGNVMIRDELERGMLETGALDELASAHVLDIGCGYGYWLRRLADRGADPTRLTGIELLPERVAAAADAVPGATIVEADAAQMPLPSESQDLVLLFTVLSSVGDTGNVGIVLREARRVVAPGGLVLVYEPRLPNPLNRATRRIGRRELEPILGRPIASPTLTVLPALARRLGGMTSRLYPWLARLPLLRTHHLLVHRITATLRP